MLLLLALTFAAAIRPGVEWLGRHLDPGVGRDPASLPRRRRRSLVRLARGPAGAAPDRGTRSPRSRGHATECESACWTGRGSTSTSSDGTELCTPSQPTGRRQATRSSGSSSPLPPRWYLVPEHDSFIRLSTALAPESRREQARMTYLEIDRRLGSYTRLRFLMVFAVGTALSAGFYVVGLDYWLLVGAFVGVAEIVPIIGLLFGAILVARRRPTAIRARRGARPCSGCARFACSRTTSSTRTSRWARLGSHRWSRSSPSPSSASSSAALPSSSPCPSRQRWERSSTSSCSATNRPTAQPRRSLRTSRTR